MRSWKDGNVYGRWNWSHTRSAIAPITSATRRSSAPATPLPSTAAASRRSCWHKHSRKGRPSRPAGRPAASATRQRHRRLNSGMQGQQASSVPLLVLSKLLSKDGPLPGVGSALDMPVKLCNHRCVESGQPLGTCAALPGTRQPVWTHLYSSGRSPQTRAAAAWESAARPHPPPAPP